MGLRRLFAATAVADRPARYRLFLSGAGPRTDALKQAVGALCDDRHGTEGWTLQVVDVRADPGPAREAGVFLTPALHRVEPGPELRWFGDLSNAEALARAFAEIHV